MAAAHTVPHTRILAGLVLGAVVGCTANALTAPPAGPSMEAAAAVIGAPAAATTGLPPASAWVPRARVMWVVNNLARPVGDVFLNLLFMAIIPLVFASLAVGVTKLGGTANVGRVGTKTLAYFLITTACAAAIGLTLVNAVRPGHRLPADQRDQLKGKYAEQAGEAEKKAAFGVQTFV